MNITCFDLETSPLDRAYLEMTMPTWEIEAPANYKKPESIKAYVEETTKAKQQAWFDKAALSPVTGRVEAIGWLPAKAHTDEVMFTWAKENEASALDYAWQFMESEHGRGHMLVGFNIFHFDLAFLAKRSWKHGIKVPWEMFDGRFWNRAYFIDLMERWCMGRKDDRISLDQLARFLSLEGKAGNGADFYKLSREEQISYLSTDLRLTRAIAERML